jgi:uncharacterized Fe-S radical SAM superfamily protein PflX
MWVVWCKYRAWKSNVIEEEVSPLGASMCMVPCSINLIGIFKVEKHKTNIVNYYHSIFFIFHVLSSIFCQNINLSVHHYDHMVVGVTIVVFTHCLSDVGNDGALVVSHKLVSRFVHGFLGFSS